MTPINIAVISTYHYMYIRFLFPNIQDVTCFFCDTKICELIILYFKNFLLTSASDYFFFLITVYRLKYNTIFFISCFLIISYKSQINNCNANIDINFPACSEKKIIFEQNINFCFLKYLPISEAEINDAEK